MTVPDLTRYRAWCLAQGHGLKTVDKSVRYLRHFSEDKGLDLDPSTLTEDRVIEFVARCREKGVHPKTINNYVRELNLWSRFHTLGWKLTYFRRHAPVLMDLLTEEDETKLREVRFSDPSINARDRAMLLLSLDQGPRRDEMLQMRLSDLVDTPDGGKGILVRRGKGDKPRLLYLSPEAWEAIDAYVRVYRVRSDSQSLFTAARGPVSYGMMGKIAKQIGRAAGVPAFTWHRGRHRVIDAMLDRQVPLPAIQAIAGHARAETTVGYASRRVLRNLTEREVRNFQKRRFEPVRASATDEREGGSVVNPGAGMAENYAGTGI
ncbi:MAG: tyrosine-type recombinase/integrase [Thermoplasmata archaeon]